MAAAVLAVVAVAAVAVWVVLGRGAAAPEATGPPASAADPTAASPGDGVVEPGPPADPDPPPFDTTSTALEELRASDRYVALAEHQRAREYEWPENIDGAWVIFNRAGYANTEQLWDEVVGPIRDDALLAGEPFTEPVWNEIPVPAPMPVGWSEEQTGRGDGFLFLVVFTDPAGQPVMRTHAVLVRRDAGGDGRVVARMPAFDVRREDASDYLQAANPAADRVWEWIVAQPEEDR